MESTRRGGALLGRQDTHASLVAYKRMTLIGVGVLAINHVVLAAGGHLFAASCVDAVVLVLAINLAAASERRTDGRDLTIGRALGALALVAAVPVAAAALPLGHISEATATLGLALLVSGSSFYFAQRHEIELRLLFPPAEADVRAVKLVAAVVPLACMGFGFCAYLLNAPTLNTHGVGTTLLGLIALTSAAVAEELLFRGVVQTSLAENFGAAGVVLAGFLSAALFTTVGWWLIPVVCASLSFGLVVAITRALGPAIIAHIGFVLGAGVVWPWLLDRSPPAHPIWVPAGIILCGGFLVAVVAALVGERRNV